MYKVYIKTKSGKETIAKAVKDSPVLFKKVPYSFIIKHKNMQELKPFYYGPQGTNTDMKKYTEVTNNYNRNRLVPFNVIVGAEIRFEKFDGRERSKMKKLPPFSIEMLVD